MRRTTDVRRAMLRPENDACWFESCLERASVAKLCSAQAGAPDTAANSVILRENLGHTPRTRQGFSRKLGPQMPVVSGPECCYPTFLRMTLKWGDGAQFGRNAQPENHAVTDTTLSRTTTDSV